MFVSDIVRLIPEYKKIKLHREQNIPYYGPKLEFGTNALRTRKLYPNYYKRIRPSKIDFKKFLKNYFRENFYQP